jgi:hypothetical protein
MDDYRYVDKATEAGNAHVDFSQTLWLGRLTLHSIKDPDSFFVKISYKGQESYGRHRRTR